MGRQPIHKEGVGGAANAREAIWRAIPRDSEFTSFDFPGTIPMGTIQDYLRGLEKAGYIARMGATVRGRKLRYKLVRDVGVEAPRVTKDGLPVTQGKSREQMWRTMGVLGEFSVTDLAVHASTEQTHVAVRDAKSYIYYLNKAGYLAQIDPGGPGKPARYRMLRSKRTGPRPPMVQRIRQVWDPNLQRVVWTGDQSK